MILIYAFSNPWSTNISTRTLIDLQETLRSYPDIVFQKITKYPQPFFEEYIRNKLYTAIVGLGDYYGSFDKIKIESQASNLYGHHSIIPLAPSIIDLDLPFFKHIDRSQFFISSSMSPTYGNWLAYNIQSLINQKQLTTYHLFFHLPERSNSQNNATNIANLLITNQVLQ